MTEPVALRLKEAARALSVSPSTIKNWVSQGKLESVKIGEGQRATRLILVASIKKLLGQEAA